jgi:hypothetical protein
MPTTLLTETEPSQAAALNSTASLTAARVVQVRLFRHRRDWNYVLQCEFQCEDDGGIDLKKLEAHLQVDTHCTVTIPPPARPSAALDWIDQAHGN